MGILYQNDNDILSESDATIKPEAPPQFYFRPARPKRTSRASRIQFQLPEYLAASLLSDNPEIAPWLLGQSSMAPPYPSYPSRITIQHHTPTPQSLPPSLANSVIPDISRVASPAHFPISGFSNSPLLFPLERDDEELS